MLLKLHVLDHGLGELVQQVCACSCEATSWIANPGVVGMGFSGHHHGVWDSVSSVVTLTCIVLSSIYDNLFHHFWDLVLKGLSTHQTLRQSIPPHPPRNRGLCESQQHMKPQRRDCSQREGNVKQQNSGSVVTNFSRSPGGSRLFTIMLISKWTCTANEIYTLRWHARSLQRSLLTFLFPLFCMRLAFLWAKCSRRHFHTRTFSFRNWRWVPKGSVHYISHKAITRRHSYIPCYLGCCVGTLGFFFDVVLVFKDSVTAINQKKRADAY